MTLYDLPSVELESGAGFCIVNFSLLPSFFEEGRKSGISRSQKLKREMNYGPRMVMVGNFSKPSSANSSPL